MDGGWLPRISVSGINLWSRKEISHVQMVLDYVSRHLPGILGYGLKRWTFSYIDDVAEGHSLALEKGKTGERYILGRRGRETCWNSWTSFRI